MSTDAAPTPLSKVDSAVQGLSSSPPKDASAKRRASSSVPGVYNINDLGMLSSPVNAVIKDLATSLWPNTINAKADKHGNIEKEGTELQIAKETQKLNW